MAKNLFVGNLPFAMTDDNLLQVFSAYGQVTSANIVKDKMTGRSRGFGFVEFSSDEDAAKAIAELNNSDQMGRNIVVKEALPRPERSNKA
ncbi:RNA-binding protein [Patescibacteria group bacterium]|nr:RNA-binding protein [Patescibacteria group bacterium]